MIYWWTFKQCLIISWQNTILLSQASDAIIRFSHSSDFSADSIGLHSVQHSTCTIIDIDQIDLNWSVILCVNDSVASRAKIEEKLRLWFLFSIKSLLIRRHSCVRIIAPLIWTFNQYYEYTTFISLAILLNLFDEIILTYHFRGQ